MGFNWNALLDLSKVNVDFRRWVLDIKNELEVVSENLDILELESQSLDAYSFAELEKEILTQVSANVISVLNTRMEEFETIVKDFSEEDHKFHREFLKAHLWSLVGQSPLLRRAQTKPLGYAGDYEMMNMLYRNHAEGKSFFGKVMNIVAASLPVAQANINRIEFLNTLILDTLERTIDPCITSVGSGPAREVEVYFNRVNKNFLRNIHFTLFDQESRAIDQCKRNILPIVTHGSSLTLLETPIKKILSRSKVIDNQNLIYSAGLFDYFSDNAFHAFAQKLLDSVVPGGKLVIGNVNYFNPSRLFMEYFTEWFLVHRTREDLLKLGSDLKGATSLEVKSEPTGVNLFLFITKAS